jgi:hypothetical protein
LFAEALPGKDLRDRTAKEGPPGIFSTCLRAGQVRE